MDPKRLVSWLLLAVCGLPFGPRAPAGEPAGAVGSAFLKTL